MTRVSAIPTPLTTIRPNSGWAALNLREMWQFRDLLFALAVRDVKLRYRQTAVGVAWVIFQPLIAAGALTIVFGLIARIPSDVPYFALAFAGQIGWTVFSSTFSKASASMVASSHLVSKVYFPRLILPLSTLASTLIDFAVAMVVMMVVMCVYRITPTAAVLLLPFWVVLLLLLATGLGLIAAALMVSYRDVQYVLPVLLPLLMYASPVAYPFEYAMKQLPASAKPMLSLNPLSGMLEGLRWSLLNTSPPTLMHVIYSVLFALAVAFFGAVVFKRLERRFADVI